MTKNNKYWANRAAQRMFDHMEAAEKTADQIAEIYQKASRYLSLEMEGIFEKFQTKHDLTEQEARRLINTLQDKISISDMLQQLKNEKSEKNKRELVKLLETPAYRSRIERLQELQNQIDLVMQQVYQQEKTLSTVHYMDLANEAYYRSIFDIQQRVGFGFSFSHISQKQIDKVLGSKWYGKNYSTRIWDNTRALAQDLKEELLINLLTGRTEREVAGILANKFAQGAGVARRLVRTESSYLSGQMEMESYKASGIDKYIFVATLDLRTSEICASLDNKVFLVSEAKVGVNHHPMHPWCRSTTISYISEEIRREMQRRALDPATGKTILIPATMAYEQWYNKYVKDKPEAEAEQKKIKNYAAHQKQNQKYRQILGNRIPESFAKFQDLKYNEPEKWEFVKLDYQRQNELLTHPKLLLPNAENAVVPDKKFTHYLFGGEHPEGLAKGAAFASRLGYDENNWPELQKVIRRNASKYPATFKDNNGYGDRYEQKTILYGKNDTPANVVVGWIHKADGTTSMSSVYIKEVK